MIFEATILKITCFQAIFEFSNFCCHMPGCSWNAQVRAQLAVGVTSLSENGGCAKCHCAGRQSGPLDKDYEPE